MFESFAFTNAHDRFSSDSFGLPSRPRLGSRGIWA
jgi:hypothetical protein